MHKALYRSYRPTTFDDVVGQKHITKTLKNQIHNDNIGHAYLFCGTRGTGKTSTAKIFSRAVNCPNSIDQEPCNECNVCKDILMDRTMDIVEIDAASNNSVDDIRELRESVKYSPTEAKYKVYIIDEVHMLSSGAFNALLKTLEEPPSYVIFILATTEPHKIPATIISRCQRFDFKRVTVKDISSRMKKICKEENVEVEEKALDLIARNSQGALRDALSILDQCMSFGDNKINYQDVIELLGTINTDQLFELSNYIIDQNTKKSLEILNELVLYGKDIRILIDELISHFRNLMVCKVSMDVEELISLPEESITQLREQAQNIDINDLIRILNILSVTQNEIKVASNPRLLAEITFMKIAQPMFDESKEALIKRIENLERIIETGNIKVTNVVHEQTEDKVDTTKEDIENDISAKKEGLYEEIKEEDIKLVEHSWKKILQKIKSDRKAPLYALLNEVDFFSVYSNTLHIIFDDAFKFSVNRLYSKETTEYVEKVMREIISRNFRIKLVLKSEVENIIPDIKKKKDKGEEFLRETLNEEVLEVKETRD